MKCGTFASAIALWALAGLSISTQAEIRVYRQVGSTFVQVGAPEVVINTTSNDVTVNTTAASSDWFIGRIFDTNQSFNFTNQSIGTIRFSGVADETYRVTVTALPVNGSVGNLVGVAWPAPDEETTFPVNIAGFNITAFIADPDRPNRQQEPRSTIKLRMGLSGTVQEIQATTIPRVDAGRFAGSEQRPSSFSSVTSNDYKFVAWGDIGTLTAGSFGDRQDVDLLGRARRAMITTFSTAADPYATIGRVTTTLPDAVNSDLTIHDGHIVATIGGSSAFTSGIGTVAARGAFHGECYVRVDPLTAPNDGLIGRIESVVAEGDFVSVPGGPNIQCIDGPAYQINLATINSPRGIGLLQSGTLDGNGDILRSGNMNAEVILNLDSNTGARFLNDIGVFRRIHAVGGSFVGVILGDWFEQTQTPGELYQIRADNDFDGQIILRNRLEARATADQGIVYIGERAILDAGQNRPGLTGNMMNYGVLADAIGGFDSQVIMNAKLLWPDSQSWSKTIEMKRRDLGLAGTVFLDPNPITAAPDQLAPFYDIKSVELGGGSIGGGVALIYAGLDVPLIRPLL